MRTITSLQLVCVAIAALSFGYLFTLLELTETYQYVLAIIGIVAVVVAYLSIRFRATALPVTLRPRHYGRIGRYGLYVFRFADPGAAERFATVNRHGAGG